MPGVTVLQSSPAHRFGPLSTGFPGKSNGTHNVMSVAELKEKAKSSVEQVRGASASALIKQAGNQAVIGREKEQDGDLVGAYGALLRAANLTQLLMTTAEFKSESGGKRGTLWRDFVQFQQLYGNDLLPRMSKLEAKLTELERSGSLVNGVPNGSANENNDGPIRKPGGSIADRMRALQDHGMEVATASKRFARDFSTNSPSTDSKPSAISRAPSSQPPLSSPSIPITPSSSRYSDSSNHAFVAPSSLGPPSPTSSSSSSPRLSQYTASEFNQAFPSIDELDEGAQSAALRFPSLPSVPNTAPGSKTGEPLVSPSILTRFPSLPAEIEPDTRPVNDLMNTSIAPALPSISGRPDSPNGQRPVSVSKPPNLAASHSPARISPSSSGERPQLPVLSSINPKLLHDLISKQDFMILLLDLRTRDDFDKEHIKADGEAVVCLEPSVLEREGLTAEKLEDSLVIAPLTESVLFRNRERFDLVVMYDQSSDNITPSMKALSRLIFETSFRKNLKRPPVPLIGGFKAWKTQFPVETAQGGRASPQTSSVQPMPVVINANGSEDSRVRTNGVSKQSPPMSPTFSSDGMNGASTSEPQHEIWMPPRPRSGIDPGMAFPQVYVNGDPSSSRSGQSMGTIPEMTNHSRSPAESNGYPADQVRKLQRKPAFSRPPSMTSLQSMQRTGPDQHQVNGHSSVQFPIGGSIQYPQFPRSTGTTNFGAFSPPSAHASVSMPPQASINPSLSRRRSDYIDNSEQAISTIPSRPIDYPDLSVQNVVRPPPAVATPTLERQEYRPRMSASYPSNGPKPPIIHSDYPITYWPDTMVSTSGLRNLGNTCYMNSTIQCLSATVPFAKFFTDGRWKSAVNMLNPLGSKGQLTQAFATLVHEMWNAEIQALSPVTFRKSICFYAKQFAGSEQHDCQEFLNFIMDGLHEDLNRVMSKPNMTVTPEREAELEHLPQQIASDQEWKIYRMRDDSVIVDFFHGQFRNRMECMTCHKTSTTYNPFMYLSLPIPTGRSLSRVTLQQCLDAFVQDEVMEKADAWHCPNCKALRKASKRLSIVRLPPILLIHLKRFSHKGSYTDKLETFVDFPLKNLDLTNYMPSPLPPGSKGNSAPISLDDPRTQIPPYRYDLYAVTNHFGTLSSGHYTAYINSRGSWLYCDDSRVTSVDSKEVVGRPAYVLYYKRVKS